MKLCRFPFASSAIYRTVPYTRPSARPSPRRCQAVRAVEGSASTGADDLLKQADDLLAQMAQGHFQKSTASQDAPLHSSTEQGPGFQVQCDVNGCIIVPVAQEEAASSRVSAGGEIDSETLSDPVQAQGPRWRLGYDRSPASMSSYTSLVGADNFSVELTRQEYDDFIKLLKNLRQSVATLQICGEWGSGKEEATLQMSTERVWMQGRVPQKRLTTLQNMWNRNNGTTHEAFSLQFIFTTPGQRQVEGKWDAETVMTVLKHLDSDSELLPPGITADLAEAVPA